MPKSKNKRSNGKDKTVEPTKLSKKAKIKKYHKEFHGRFTKFIEKTDKPSTMDEFICNMVNTKITANPHDKQVIIDAGNLLIVNIEQTIKASKKQ